MIKDFSRTTTRVLMRLDPSKLDLTNPRVHRKDGDFAVTWAKMYGKGRVFYSTLGHVEARLYSHEPASTYPVGRASGTRSARKSAARTARR